MFGKGFEVQDKAKGARSGPIGDLEPAERAGIKGQSTVASLADANASEDRGIIPRSIAELFGQIRTQEAPVTVYCSFV